MTKKKDKKPIHRGYTVHSVSTSRHAFSYLDEPDTLLRDYTLVMLNTPRKGKHLDRCLLDIPTAVCKEMDELSWLLAAVGTIRLPS